MMSTRKSKAYGAVVAAFSLTGLLALSACEERPYPTASRSYEAPKPPPPVAPLAGAPAYTPPPPPPQAYAPPPVRTYAPPPPERYESTVIVGMAPIPNPGEPGSDGYYQGYRPHGHHGYAAAPSYDDGYAPRPRHKTYHTPAPPKAYAPAPKPAPTYAAKPPVKDYKPAPKPPVYAAKPAPTYAAKPVTPPPPPKKPDTYAQKGAVAGAAVGAVVGVIAKDTKPGAKAVVDTAKATYDAKKAPPAAPVTAAKVAQDTKAVAVAAVAGANVAAKDIGHTAMAATDKAKDAVATTKAAVAPAPAAKPAAAAGNSADRSTRLAATQSALTDAISKGAVLTTPPRFTANTPADVTLTVPAGFYDTVHKEAEKNGLTDAAASVNMTAVLSGDGFSVTPDETQSVPLTVGQPTEFRWTVTAQPGAKGPLHADVGADLLGSGSDTLALGSVQKAGGFGPKLTPAIIGWAILVLIAALVVAWLARGRGPTRSSTARRASRAARSGARPLDMGTDGAH